VTEQAYTMLELAKAFYEAAERLAKTQREMQTAADQEAKCDAVLVERTRRLEQRVRNLERGHA
jgi:hypothetical protein